MGATLNPNLLAEDTTAVLNAAVSLMDRYRKKNIFPELALLALIDAKDTPGYDLLQRYAATNNTDLTRLARQARLAVESRRDLPGDLTYISKNNQSIQLSRQMIIAIDEALTLAEQSNEVWVRTDHLLAALSQKQLGTGGILQQYGITPQTLLAMINGSPAKSASTSAVARQMGGTAVDYVALARAGEKRPVYFREALLTELINMLTQRINRHVILLGPEGVGKRTLAYSLALLMAEGKGPRGLDRLVQIDEAALLDNPVRAIRAGINRAEGGILFVPQIHRFFDQQTRLRQPKVVADLQKAFLADNPILIGTTTEATYNEELAAIPGLGENCQRLRVPEPSEKEAIAILHTLTAQIAEDYDLKVQDEAITIATTLARRYMSGTPLPRSAENLLHRAAALVNMSSQQHIAFKTGTPDDADDTLDAEDVTLAASQMTGIPVSKLGEDERNRYASMVEHLHERIIGQDEAVMAVSRAVKTARVGLKDKKRPIGGFLFLGPTGVGKTELAKALAEFMFGNEDAMLQLDMSEFQNESTVNRLIGSPSGYVDSEAGGQLTERVRQQPYLIVLFDEVEKAHARVLDILLQVLEEGRLTDGRGNTATFSETVIIMTSNLGADYLATTEITEDIRESVMDAVNDHFRPEFLNRLDEIVLFHPLNNDHLAQILDLLLNKEQQLTEARGLTLEFTDRAKLWMLEQNEHPEWGARPLRRIIRQYLREPLADYLLRENPGPGTIIRVGVAKNQLNFKLTTAETP
ncbi:MAG: ATP-dependent Clp protease ATP-binding subunit [Anaerolineae bacterium]|nr:ATP-dependent Clp protease ATP-binding subunit [Anaerolineae bacterium]